MSTRPLRRSTRDTRRSRRNVLEVDLNETPPPDDGGLQEAQPIQPVTYIPPPPPAAIDVEAIEDDEEVLISSPRSFAEARNKARRNRSVTVVLDEDSEVARTSRLNLNSNKKRRRIPTNQSTDFGLYINLEGTDSVKRAKCSEPSQNVQAPPPPPPKEATFSCPVCMGQLSEETSTRCGHIFCKNCIKAAIAAQNKCPTCRRRITLRDTFRVYLPATG